MIYKLLSATAKQESTAVNIAWQGQGEWICKLLRQLSKIKANDELTNLLSMFYEVYKQH